MAKSPNQYDTHSARGTIPISIRDITVEYRDIPINITPIPFKETYIHIDYIHDAFTQAYANRAHATSSQSVPSNHAAQSNAYTKPDAQKPSALELEVIDKNVRFDDHKKHHYFITFKAYDPNGPRNHNLTQEVEVSFKLYTDSTQGQIYKK